jgi:HK97 family phage major capsid protein
MTSFKSEQLNQLVEVLRDKYGIVTTTQLDRAMSDLMKRTNSSRSIKAGVSLSRIIRGLRIKAGQPALNPELAESDVQYLESTCTRALTSDSVPGQYLIPTVQADTIIEYLNLGGVARASGVRIWPMQGLLKMNVPVALQAPQFTWAAQTSATSASDPNLSQINFDLKERRCLVAIPNAMLSASVPAFDQLISELIGLAAAEHEDTFLFSSTQVSGAPMNIVGAANLTTLNANSNNANGGSLLFTDLTAMMAAMARAKGKPPFCWYASPRTFWQRIVGLTDTSSRPLFIPTATQGLQEPIRGAFWQGFLLGFPIWCSPFISETESVGSGSNQSHLILCNSSYIHLAQQMDLSLAVSAEFLFSSNQTALRATQLEDSAVAPAAGVVVLNGIN